MVSTASKQMGYSDDELNEMTMQFFVDLMDEHTRSLNSRSKTKGKESESARLATPEETSRYFGAGKK